MSIKFKINLTLAMIIGGLSLFIMGIVSLEFFHLLPKAIAHYLTGFSFVALPVIFIVAVMNYLLFVIILIINRKTNKDLFNMKLFIILNFLGLVPYIFYFLAICFIGF